MILRFVRGSPITTPKRTTTGSLRPSTLMRGGYWRRASLVLATAVSPVVVAGCGGSSPSSSASSTTQKSSATTTSTTSGVTTTTSTATPAPFYEVSTGTVKGLGKVLVDGQGMTLYLFVPDKQSGTSTCYGQCAVAWPPLLLPTGVTVPVAGPGVQSSLLGTTHRTDGTTEVTYNKWPLYLYVTDSVPGQATGQAINNLGGLWYVVSPDGHAITTRP
jgi:predicted lipoprotein with Yx(FWY)xxD motif